MKLLRLAALAGALVALEASPAIGGTTLSVPGASNPFLAGMPSGTTCCGGDSAPGQSPVLAGAVTAGSTLTFTSLSGGVSFSGGVPTDGPDGNSGSLVSTAVFEGGATVINGIAGYNNTPVDALIGVFLGPGLPTTISPLPTDLDFGPSGLTTSFASLSPGLQQIFFIGDGLTGTGSGSVQNFIVPAGATRLYLGTVDGFGWSNNTGAISVTVNGLATGVTGVPEPATWAMMLAGIGMIGGALRLRGRQAFASPLLDAA